MPWTKLGLGTSFVAQAAPVSLRRYEDYKDDFRAGVSIFRYYCSTNLRKEVLGIMNGGSRHHEAALHTKSICRLPLPHPPVSQLCRDFATPLESATGVDTPVKLLLQEYPAYLSYLILSYPIPCLPYV